MKRLATTVLIGLMALAGPALARQDDMDVNRLNSSLNQLASDPTLGTYAQAEQALAHAAIDRLEQASRSERPRNPESDESRSDGPSVTTERHPFGDSKASSTAGRCCSVAEPATRTAAEAKARRFIDLNRRLKSTVVLSS